MDAILVSRLAEANEKPVELTFQELLTAARPRGSRIAQPQRVYGFNVVLNGSWFFVNLDDFESLRNDRRVRIAGQIGSSNF